MADAKRPKVWTDADFQDMNWHDCAIHSIEIRNPQNSFDYDLTFDLDYILERFYGPRESSEFVIAPALLTFSSVDKLHIDLRRSYKEALEIDQIERDEITSDSKRRTCMPVFKWKIRFHSLGGEECHITFEATGFKQSISKPPVRLDRHYLEFGERL